jgi:hypothetical protein
MKYILNLVFIHLTIADSENGQKENNDLDDFLLGLDVEGIF